MKSFLSGLLKVLAVIALVVVVVAAIAKLLFVDVVVVAHNAMAPTIYAGDEVLVWRGASIEHGSIVLCHHPREVGRLVLGRVMAVEGGRIEVEREQMIIGRTRVARDYRGTVELDDTETGTHYRMRWGWEELGNDDHLFFQREGRALRMRSVESSDGLYLIGDNRTYTGEDSRTFGPVQRDRCLGVAFMRGRAVAGTPEEIPHGHLDLLR